MARTAKKAKAVTVTTAEDVAADGDVLSIAAATAHVVAALSVPEGMAADSVDAQETASGSGVEILIPLDKLKKSPRNARKTLHSNETIETYAASIAAKGILQNLVVEPEFDPDGAPTGFYFGEGRRLAQLLRAKRREIGPDEPIRCVIDTANDPFEISLDENVTRSEMHPADQFEAFRELAEHRGWGAEEIAARFGVTAHVVKQRLRLGAVSPRLMQIYRDGGLTLEQLMAFAVTDDHARQEQVYDALGYNREAYIIRRELTRTHVQANDRRRSSSARKPIPRQAARSCATSLPRIAADTSRTPPFWTGWSSKSCKTSPPSYRQRKAGNGRKSSSTTRTPTGFAASTRSRLTCRKNTLPPAKRHRRSSTA